jgi:hypothetical protein
MATVNISRRMKRTLPKAQDVSDTFIPAEDCVGKEFKFSASIYRVTQHYPARHKFSAIVLNNLNAPVLLEELFVRQHCTPVEQIQWKPRSVDTRRRDETVRNPFVFNLTIGKTTDDSVSATVGVQCIAPDANTSEAVSETVNTDAAQPAAGEAEPMDMRRYLKQTFELDGQTIRVVNYKPHKQQFTLCAISHGGTYFHRDEAWVMAHCEPAAEAPPTVTYTPLPSIAKNADKFAPGKTPGFITSRIGIIDEKRYAKDHDFDYSYLINDCNIKIQSLTYAPTGKGTPRWTTEAQAYSYYFELELWQEDIDLLNQVLGIRIAAADYHHHEVLDVCVRFVDKKRKLLKGINRVSSGDLMYPAGERAE